MDGQGARHSQIDFEIPKHAMLCYSIHASVSISSYASGPWTGHKLSTSSGGSNGRPARSLLPQPKVRIRTWGLFSMFSGANANSPG